MHFGEVVEALPRRKKYSYGLADGDGKTKAEEYFFENA